MGDECASTQWPILGVSACRDAVSREARGLEIRCELRGSKRRVRGSKRRVRGSKRRGVEVSAVARKQAQLRGSKRKGVEASARAWKQAQGRGSKRKGTENPRIGNPRLRSAHCPGDRRCNFAVFVFLSSRRFDGGLFPASDFQSVDSSGCFVECFAECFAERSAKCFAERSAKCFTESQLFSPSRAASRDVQPKRRLERGQRRQACR